MEEICRQTAYAYPATFQPSSVSAVFRQCCAVLVVVQCSSVFCVCLQRDSKADGKHRPAK
ncbi:hypothetical protein E2C01_099831 [Portunus trituberculatus]|uniref:Uncharacterized protein n=1 Tax=Portunus trituberculatus TaxID=210409 RepID=A0A5B7KFV6_PORTR|nr:hypothetical protein [Portunus trituberculatus]